MTDQSGTGDVESLDAETQRLVNAHFEAASDFWTEIYEGKDVVAVICQRRRDIALAWIGELGTPVGSRILEVGCGAGLMAVELARKGFEVDATDTVAEMIELTRRHAEQAKVRQRVRAVLNDVHAIDFDRETFDVVIALGVIPWLHSPHTAIQEIARVLKPGAHLIVSANNVARLTYLLDPKYNPALAPLRRTFKQLLNRLGVRLTRAGAPSRMHSRGEFDELLSVVGLQKVKGLTLGFGPFTFLGYRLLSARLELRLHHWLDLRADRGIPGMASRGAQYLVLATKAADEAS